MRERSRVPRDHVVVSLKEKIARRDLCVIIGGGVAIATCPRARSWNNALASGFDFLQEKGLRLPGWVEQEKLDLVHAGPKMLMGKAERLTEILKETDGGKLWKEWLEVTFGSLEPEHPELIQVILDLHLPIMTTNFDHLIEKVGRAYGRSLETVNWDERKKIARLNSRDEPDFVMHLHGHCEAPDSVIFDLKSYTSRIQDDFANTALRFLTSRGLLYIGCGATLDDPNLSGLREWHALYGPSAGGEYFRLVNENEKVESTNDYVKVNYGRTFADLLPFLQTLKPSGRAQRAKALPGALQAYVQHVARHWGVLDLPMPPEASRSQSDPVEALYVQRTFVLEQEQRDAAAAASSFAAKAVGSVGEQTVELAKRLAESAPLLIVADAGMGKTALSRRLAWVYAQRRFDSARAGPAFSRSDLPDTSWLPVLIPGGLLRKGDASGQLKHLINAALRVPGFDPAWADEIARAADDSRGPGVLLIVDGLDEVSPRQLREKVGQILKTITVNGQIVVTSRRDGQEKELRLLSERFERLRIEPLDDDQSKVFLDAYIGNVEDAAARRGRIDAAMSDPRVPDITRVPLGLAMLAQRSAHPGAAGDGLSALLRWMVAELIERRGAKLKPPLEARDVVPILQFLALEVTRRDAPEVLRRSLIESVLRSFREFPRLARGRDVRKFLDAVVETNILAKRETVEGGGFDENTYGFIFKQVREYLAAGGLVWGRTTLPGTTAAQRFLAQVAATPVVNVEITKREPLVIEPTLDARWLSVLTLTPGQMIPDEAEEVVRALIAASDDDDDGARRAKVQLATRALADVRDPSRSTVVAVAEACTEVLDARDEPADSGLLNAAVLHFLSSSAAEPAVDRFVEFAAYEPTSNTRSVVMEWAIHALVKPAQYNSVEAMQLPGGIDAHLTALHHDDDVTRGKAALRLLDIGFRSEEPVLARLAWDRSAALSESILRAALAPNPGARLAAQALAWLTRAIPLEDPIWTPPPRFITGLIDGIMSPDTADGAYGYLALALAKLTTKPEDVSDQIYRWAVIADREAPLVKSPRRKRPMKRLLPAIKNVMQRLTDRVSDRQDLPYFSLMLGRFGIVTDASAHLLAKYVLEQRPDRARRREAIMHLGRAGTPASEDALLRIYKEATRSAERDESFVALIANASLPVWRSMLERSMTDEGEKKTLALFLAEAGDPVLSYLPSSDGT